MQIFNKRRAFRIMVEQKLNLFTSVPFGPWIMFCEMREGSNCIIVKPGNQAPYLPSTHEYNLSLKHGLRQILSWRGVITNGTVDKMQWWALQRIKTRMYQRKGLTRWIISKRSVYNQQVGNKDGKLMKISEMNEKCNPFWFGKYFRIECYIF